MGGGVKLLLLCGSASIGGGGGRSFAVISGARPVLRCFSVGESQVKSTCGGESNDVTGLLDDEASLLDDEEILDGPDDGAVDDREMVVASLNGFLFSD